MYNQDSEDEVLKCLEDVVKGYTVYEDKFFIKHLNIFEDNKVRSFYNSEMKNLLEIPTRDEQEKMLIDNGVWSKDKQSDLNLTKIRLDAAKSTLPNVLIKAQRDPIQKQIEDLEKKYRELVSEKAEYIGTVREDIANENTCEFIVQMSVFKDEGLREKAFERMEDLYEENLQFVSDIKSAVFFVKMISGSFICKKMACCNSFQAILNVIPKKYEYRVFDTKISELTSNQISLVQYGQVFRAIIENYDITDEQSQNPDKLLEIPQQAKKIEEIQKKAASSEANSSYLGATPEEMKKMGMSGSDIFSLLQESGKESLGKDDLI